MPIESRSKPFVLTVLLLTVLLTPAARATETAQDTVAEIGGKAVRLADLEASLAGELARVETERHRVLTAGLERLVAERLLELEAAQHEMSVESLLASKAAPAAVTEADIDDFYTRHRARLQQPKEALAGQIRAHLEAQQAVEAQTRFIAELAAKHGVEKHLEPLRFMIDTAGAPAKGSAGAAVTVVEFSDFQCPGCAGLQPTLSQLSERFGDKVRIVFKQFPLRSIHPEAQKAAEASLCAEDQGEFWAMHDAFFAQQRALDTASLSAKARELGLDGEKFDACLESGEMAAVVDADLRIGQQIGVASTPSLFVNGRPVAFPRGADPLETLATLIDEELGSAAR